MPGSLALALDIADYESIAASRESIDVLVACDPELHVELRRRGVRHLTPWDLIDAQQLAYLRECEQQLIAFWRANAVARFEGINLLTAAEFRHAGALSRVLWCHAIIVAALRRARPDRVLVIDQPQRHALSQPPHIRTFPLLQTMLAGVAEPLGAVLKHCPTSLAAAEFEDVVAQRRIAPSPRAIDTSPLARRRFVLFHGNGIDLDRQRELAAAIRATSDLALVHVYGNSTPDRIAALDTIFDFAWPEAALRESADSLDVLPIAGEAASRWSAAVSNAPAHLREILANPGLRPHIDFIFGDYLTRLADHALTWSRFFDRHRPAALVTHYQAPILDVAVSMSIPSIILPHGVNFDVSQWYTGMPACRIAALSETHREVLISAGVEPARITITGDPWLRRRSRQTDTATARHQVGLPADRPVVLLCTSHLGWLAKNEYLPQTCWPGAIETLLELRALADRKPTWQFALKCHPRYDHHELYPQLISGGNAIPIFRDPSIHDLAAAADVVVFLNVFSSAMIECAACGVPTLLLCNHMPGFEPDRVGLSHWLLVRSVERLEKTIESILCSPAARAEAIEKTQLGLRQYLRGTPSDPLACAASQVIEMTASATSSTPSRTVHG